MIKDAVIHLDKIDRKLLFEMDDNCRQSHAQIGRKIGISKQVVSYRLKRLIDQRVITTFYALIDIAKFGFTLYRVQYRLQNADSDKQKEIIKFLSEHPSILWVASTGGRWEMVIDIMAKNVVQFDRILGEIDKRFPNNLQNRDILILVDALHYKRSYLINSRKSEEIIFVGGEPREHDLGKTDLKILSIIAKNSLIQLTSLAEELRTSTDVVRYRIKKLEEKGYITGYRALIHPNTFGYSTYKMLMKLQKISPEKFKEMLTFGNLHLNITYGLKTIGAWDFEFEMEVESDRQFQEIVMEVKNKFSNIIRDYEMLRIFYDHRFNYFPLGAEEA